VTETLTAPWLVTGGAGFIGRAVVRALRAEGVGVVVLDALTYAAHGRDLRSIDGVELVVGDVAEPSVVAEVFDRYRPEVVLNLASESHVDRSLEDASPFVRANTLGAWVVARAALAAGSRLVQVSTDEVYGDRDGRPASIEGDPVAPTNPYSVAKAAGDGMVLALVRSDGLDAVVTRAVNTFGPGQHPEKLLPLAAARWGAGERMGVYGDGRQEREWLHVDDHAAGIVEAARHGSAGSIYHLGGGAGPIPNVLLLLRWRAALGYPDVELDEGFDSNRGVAATVPAGTGGWPFLETVADRPGHDRRYWMSCTSTAQALGWAPACGFRERLDQAARWHLAHPDFWTP
jgi:dTDP-glucose 4,6-dehydratase